MEARKVIRPFDNFRVAIIDPSYFFGRSDLLSAIQKSPFEVRVILGGSRMGKTTVLNGIRLNFLDAENNAPFRAFPVLFDFKRDQPKSLENFLYLLIRRLKEAITNSHVDPNSPSNFGQNYHRFLRQLSGAEVGILGIKLNVTNPDKEQSLTQEDFRQDLVSIIKKLQEKKFEGICLLFDGAEFIIGKDWGKDTLAYLRSLKDTDTSISSCMGIILSGYRDLKNYRQSGSSPLLNIARIEWLKPLSSLETKALISHRCREEKMSLHNEGIKLVIDWAGGHPYLTQQMLNVIFDKFDELQSLSFQDLVHYLIRKQHDQDFSAWWDGRKSSYGFGEREQAVYLALSRQRKGTPETLAKQVSQSLGEIDDALDVLVGAGVVLQVDDEEYSIGAKLFAEWVTRECDRAASP